MQRVMLVCVWTLIVMHAPLVLAVLQRHDYVISSDELPDVRFRPVIGNGHIATNVLSDTVYMNGLYNGEEDKSSRARIPNYVAVDVIKDNDTSRKYELDMYKGYFRQLIQRPDSNVTITYYAHRRYTRLLLTRVDVRRNPVVKGKITLRLDVNRGHNSTDFEDDEGQMRQEQTPWAYGRYYSGTVRNMEKPGTRKTELHVYHTQVPAEVSLPAKLRVKSWEFAASLSQNKSDAKDSFELFRDSGGNMMASHVTGWKGVWDEGRLDIEDDEELSQNIAAATYNILCSIPDRDDPYTPFFGLSPGGLSRGGLLVPSMPGGGHNDYAGHVFWDMDTWMMPGIMMLHPGMARRMIGARTRVLDQAKKNAREAGFKGVKFPWEQAATGIEATPKWAGQMSRYEIHITADIAYGLRQYLYATGDATILGDASHGLELALETARFWQSRVTLYKNPERVEILGVMGPDEYHFNISNSVFTNYNAKLNLLLPKYIVDNFDLKDQINSSVRQELREFSRTAGLIKILFDEGLQYHPQYEGFNRTLQIKQSDVILLGYPLMMPMSKAIRQNDLEIYESITNPEGPDTGTWSMHTVGWLELGDEARAYKNFKMMFRNINKPFKVFSEKPVTGNSTGGCVNFITAAGGLLQSVVFGYGGLRLHEDRLQLWPRLLPGNSSWTMTGLHYRGAIFDVSVSKNSGIRVLPTYLPSTGAKLFAMANQQKHELRIGRSLSLNSGSKFSIMVEDSVTSMPAMLTSTTPSASTSTTKSEASQMTLRGWSSSLVILFILHEFLTYTVD